MLLVFQVCFFVGIGLTLISFILGNVFDLSGLDGLDIDVDFDTGMDSLFPVNSWVIVLFVTVFGGSGMILVRTFDTEQALIIVLAAVIGLAVSILLNKLVFIPLKKAQNTSAPDLEELIGILAKVNETIGEDGFGEITYVVNGNSFNAPAKSIEGTAIVKGTEVAVCQIDEHIFYVMPVRDKFN